MNKGWANLIMWVAGTILTIYGAAKLFGPEAIWFTAGCLLIAYTSIHGIIYGLIASRMIGLRRESRPRNHF